VAAAAAFLETEEEVLDAEVDEVRVVMLLDPAVVEDAELVTLLLPVVVELAPEEEEPVLEAVPVDEAPDEEAEETVLVEAMLN